ncbi:TPA: hypothetical protein N2D80_003177 [Clostridium botulinum]|nr:hypothetical protein [Clostridium botulinum]HDI4925023.1 hypothetical protein [Clostridium botulinum]
MSFENGYNIMDYIGDTVEKYKKDNNIFNEALKLLNIYMLRTDWPYCYTEYCEITKVILGNDCEWISKYYGQFFSEAKRGNQSLKEWDKELSESFKNDCKIFFKIIVPIINQYYDYVNNPLGIKKLVHVNNNNDIMKIIRIERNDGKFLDLNLHNFDIKQLSESLNTIISEEKGDDCGTN